MSKQILQRWTLVVAALVLVACTVTAPNGRRAPIMEYGSDKKPGPAGHQAAVKRPVPVMDSDAEPSTRIYIVQKGDTLYSIAFLHGVDYRDVAEWNHLDNPAAIKIGQALQLHTGTAPKEESRTIVLTPAISSPTTTSSPVISSPAIPSTVETKSSPKVGKVVYSDKALAQAEAMQNEVTPVAVTAPVVAPVVVAKPTVVPVRPVDDEDPLDWGMPTSGKVVAGFSENDNRKGIDIVGQRGQAVLASAAGKVVYSGSGLRGYGKLVIIKHNKTYLSAYAHNDQILVKEGQNVKKGQKIAEMGNTDTDQVKLHFEIRKLGKPVDPAKYLPLAKS